MENKPESVKIEGDVMGRVRAHIKSVRPKITISSFLSMEISRIMDKVEKRKSKKSSLN